MSKETIIDGIKFKSQKDAINYTRNILVSLESIGEVSITTQGWNYLNALIKRHPEYASKRGKGITSIIITRDYNKNIAMNLKRVDGSIVDISWIYCVKSTHATPYQNLMSAMRLAIKYQIDEFRHKEQQSSGICGICLNPISSFDKTHIDHEPTFKKLAENFVKENGSPPEQFDNDITTNQAKFTASSHKYSKRWQEYHSKHAKLRLTHAKCNLSRSR